MRRTERSWSLILGEKERRETMITEGKMKELELKTYGFDHCLEV
jgi:hypothetical protein